MNASILRRKRSGLTKFNFLRETDGIAQYRIGEFTHCCEVSTIEWSHFMSSLVSKFANMIRPFPDARRELSLLHKMLNQLRQVVRSAWKCLLQGYFQSTSVHYAGRLFVPGNFVVSFCLQQCARGIIFKMFRYSGRLLTRPNVFNFESMYLYIPTVLKSEGGFRGKIICIYKRYIVGHKRCADWKIAVSTLEMHSKSIWRMAIRQLSDHRAATYHKSNILNSAMRAFGYEDRHA